jgi:exodeoxyribonuclease V gamma subunit
MSLKVYSSQKLELLAQQFAQDLKQSFDPSREINTLDVFDSVDLVMQTAGMEKWLQIQTASHNRLQANANWQIYTPQSFLGAVSKKLNLKNSFRLNWTQESLKWIIFEIFNTLHLDEKNTELEVLIRYLKSDTSNQSAVLKWNLAEQCADLFDQYGLYRPEMVNAWMANQSYLSPERINLFKHELWQKYLWTLCATKLKIEASDVAWEQKLLTEITQNRATPLFKKIWIFGVSILPVSYQKILSALDSQGCEIRFYLVNPCQEYWFDVPTDRELKSQKKWNEKKAKQSLLNTRLVEYHSDEITDVQHYDQGHRLLANWGKIGRDFFASLLDFDPEWIDLDEPNLSEDLNPSEPLGLLKMIQYDLLNLNDCLHSSSRVNTKRLIQNDGSICLNSAHSPVRELEVLHDYLLGLLHAHKGIGLDDILVMVPDMNKWAPYIDSVFGTHLDHGNPLIPWSVADKSTLEQNAFARTFLQILEVGQGRFEKSNLLSLLENGPLLNALNISTDDVDLIKQLIESASIRWGLDGQSKEKIGLPLDDVNTWKWGLQRLLLSLIMPVNESAESQILGDVQLVNGIESTGLVVALEKLIQLINVIEISLNFESQTLESWSETLSGFLTRIFGEKSKNEKDCVSLIQKIHQLALVSDHLKDTNHDDNSVDSKVPYSVILLWLKKSLREESGGKSWLMGKVTFATLVPLRSLPFKVVAMLGLDMDTLPQKKSESDFNLILQKPERGDRDVPASEKYLFLETLCSAREFLYLSWTGQNIQNNSEIPASILISELRDYCNRNYVYSEEQDAEILSIQHQKLHSFHFDYFKSQTKLNSYSRQSFELAQKLLDSYSRADQSTISPLAQIELPFSEQEIIEIELSDLLRFYKSPIEYFVKNKLRVSSPWEESESKDNEPFALDHLENWILRNEILQEFLSHPNPQMIDETEMFLIIQKKQNRGEIPRGYMGKKLLQEIWGQSQKLIDAVLENSDGAERRSLKIDYEITLDSEQLKTKKVVIKGHLHKIYENKLISVLASKKQGKYLIQNWIELVLAVLNGCDENAVLIYSPTKKGKDAEVESCHLARSEAEAYLTHLVEYYIAGSHKVMPFDPQFLWKNTGTENQNNMWLNRIFTDQIYDYNRESNIQYCALNWDFYSICEKIISPAWISIREMSDEEDNDE